MFGLSYLSLTTPARLRGGKYRVEEKLNADEFAQITYYIFSLWFLGDDNCAFRSITMDYMDRVRMPRRVKYRAEEEGDG